MKKKIINVVAHIQDHTDFQRKNKRKKNSEKNSQIQLESCISIWDLFDDTKWSLKKGF